MYSTETRVLWQGECSWDLSTMDLMILTLCQLRKLVDTVTCVFDSEIYEL